MPPRSSTSKRPKASAKTARLGATARDETKFMGWVREAKTSAWGTGSSSWSTTVPRTRQGPGTRRLSTTRVEPESARPGDTKCCGARRLGSVPKLVRTACRGKRNAATPSLPETAVVSWYRPPGNIEFTLTGTPAMAAPPIFQVTTTWRSTISPSPPASSSGDSARLGSSRTRAASSSSEKAGAGTSEAVSMLAAVTSGSGFSSSSRSAANTKATPSRRTKLATVSFRGAFMSASGISLRVQPPGPMRPKQVAGHCSPRLRCSSLRSWANARFCWLRTASPDIPVIRAISRGGRFSK